MKILSSSPYSPFNSKEWNSLVSKGDKFVDTPIKIKKRYFTTVTFKKIGKAKVQQEKNALHEQMQLIFA